MRHLVDALRPRIEEKQRANYRIRQEEQAGSSDPVGRRGAGGTLSCAPIAGFEQRRVPTRF